MPFIEVDRKLNKVFKLAEFDLVSEEEVLVKKFLFKRFETQTIIRKCYLVYVYYDYKLQDLEIIDPSLIVKDQDYLANEEVLEVNKPFITRYLKDDFDVSFEIKSFKGYKFIYDNINFIAHILESDSRVPMEILKNNLRNLNKEFEVGLSKEV